jgi:hypothetical protein
VLCWFLDAGMTTLSTRSCGRRPKSAKARNRGKWGTGGAAGAMEILPRYVRNDRGDRGNVGIIRSPVRASILPDLSRSIVGYLISSGGTDCVPSICPPHRRTYLAGLRP